MAGDRSRRHEAILGLVRSRRIGSQKALSHALAKQGFKVTQTTLSRDLRALRVAKSPTSDGSSVYSVPEEWEHSAPLERLLPTLFMSAEGSGNLVVVRTMTGAAQAVARGIDFEEWPEVLGTIAGDDTILVVLRAARERNDLVSRLERLAGEAT